MSNQRFSIVPAKGVGDADLTDSEFRTLSAYGVFGDKNGWCWPADSTIAEMRGVSRRTVIRHRKRLIDLGYLNVKRNYSAENGSQVSNIVQIKFDYPCDTKDVTPPVTPTCHTPCDTKDVTQTPHFNDPMNDPLNDDEKFSNLSGYFWTISGIPEPSAGSRGWEDWEDGINALIKIDATKDEMTRAKKTLDAGKYKCTRPGALVKTIVNNRTVRASESQKVGGQLIE